MATERVALANVRISYAFGLWQKSAYEEGGGEKFKVKFGVGHGSAQFAQVEKVLQKIAKEEWAATSGAVLKSLQNNNQKFCWIDGGNTPDKEGHAGNMILSASSKVRPTVVGIDGVTPLSEDDGVIYSGCYVNALLEFRTMDHNKFGKGIFCTLRGVQFFAKGDAFSGGAAPAAVGEFANLSTAEDDPTA